MAALLVAALGAAAAACGGGGDSERASLSARTLQSANAEPRGAFGAALALDDGRLLVGAPGEAVSGAPGAGRVYLFDARTGGLLEVFESPAPQVGGAFGAAVALRGANVLIGAPGEDVLVVVADPDDVPDTDPDPGPGLDPGLDPGPDTDPDFDPDPDPGFDFDPDLDPDGDSLLLSDGGRAYLFEVGDSAPEEVLVSPDPIDLGAFGAAVAFLGTDLLVGAPLEDGSAAGDRSGQVHRFAENGLLEVSIGGLAGDGAYGAVVLSDPLEVFAGAPGANSLAIDAGGAAFRHDRDGALAISYQSGEALPGGRFGAALATVGNVLVVGAPGEGLGAGRVHFHDRASGDPLSAGLAPTSSPNAQAGGAFGAALARTSLDALAGAPGEDADGFSGAGRAYVIDLSSGAVVATIESPAPAPAGAFGAAVAARGRDRAIGAPGEASGAGRVYINP